MANTLTGLIPTIFTALDTVSREQVGFIPAVSRNAKADAAAKDQTVTAPVAPPATTVDITPGATAPNDGDQTIGTVDVKITKSKMAPVKWNGEEQLALGPAGTYNTIWRISSSKRSVRWQMRWTRISRLCISLPPALSVRLVLLHSGLLAICRMRQMRAVLSDNGSPTTDLQMVLGSSAIANLRGKQSVLFKVNESGTDALLREGIVGRLEGFNIHESAHVKKRAASAATDYLVNGAKSEGDILIAIDTGTGSFTAGDIVTFDGDSNKYLVAAATATTITTAAPGLRQALADNSAITTVGGYTANMAFDRNAFLLAARTPAMPQGGDTADDVMNVTDPVSGITYQVALYRQYRQVRYEVGLSWGVAAVKTEHSVLLLG